MTWASKCSTLALVAAMAAASPAQAQDAAGDESAASQSNENQLTTIVVTAQRREASVQDTSAAISAFSGDALEENRTLSFEDLAGQATSLSFTALSPLDQEFNIRGITNTRLDSPSADQSVGIFVDDVYVGRSGLFNSFSIFSNHNIENILGNVPIRNYYSVLNSSIASTIHYLNYFDNAEPEIGQVSRVGEINRIRTCGLLSTETLEEKWFFDLQNPRDLCYYLCINSDKLENDGGLHRRIVDQLKEKPKNAFRKISYAIYETEHKQSFGFCVAHTNVVQENSK